MISLPVSLFSAAMVGVAASILAVFVGAAFYDFKMIKMFRAFRAHPHAAPYRRRPLISIVFITRNNQNTIATGLRSAFTGSYRNVEVIVLDNDSSDGTVAAVRDFKSHNPKRVVTLTTKRTKASDKALMQTIKRASHGEFVLVIRDGAVLDDNAVKAALQCFLVNESLLALNGRRAVIPQTTIGNLAKQLGNMVTARLAKARSGFGFKAGFSPITAYQRSALSTATKPAYVNNVVVLSARGGHPRYSGKVWHLLTWLIWAVIAAGVGYIWYVALKLHVVEPLSVLWLTATIGGLLFTLSDDYLSFGHKILTMSVLPLWYIFSCLFLILRVISPLEILTRIRITFSLAPARD